MKSDIEIAQLTKVSHIKEIAQSLSLSEDDYELYGKDKAKLSLSLLDKPKKGKLVLVTAMTPTSMGEGKTTMSIGLADGLKKLGVKVACCLREPSLGPVFGLKGGATGGGYSQVVPMEDINLHFTGDIHAMTAANNLIAAMLDNYIFQGNELNIDPNKITWRRALDINDRELRNITIGQGSSKNGVERKDGFDITVASEIMAVLCLSENIQDLKQRVSRIIVAYDKNDKPITVNDIGATGSVCVLLKDAIKPNLVQTLEKTPVIMHGGPFANIAHGCNSVIATNMGLRLADLVVTEAGFGADLGAEKFLDIKCRTLKDRPSAVVVVATIRALKYHGGERKEDINTRENLTALVNGLPNLLRHVENITKVYNLPCVVCINKFPTDTQKEIDLVNSELNKLGVNAVCCQSYEKGSEGALELANSVLGLLNEENNFTYSYDIKDSLQNKIIAVAKKIYHAKDVIFSNEALENISKIENYGFKEIPVCIAKTQYSFSDNKTLLGAPNNFVIKINSVRLMAGAGFLVALAGDIMTMPGLPKEPAALKIDIDANGIVKGIF